MQEYLVPDTERGRRLLGEAEPQTKLQHALMAHELSKSEISRRVGVTYVACCTYTRGFVRPR